MASETSSLSQSPLITTKDEFEWLEMTEFDANTIRELLYEPREEIENGGALMQAMEVAKENPDKSLAVESYWCLDEIKELENFDWFDMVGEISGPCNDTAAWYGEPKMEEINEVFEMGDYSLLQSANMYDEIGYIGLWQEN